MSRTFEHADAWVPVTGLAEFKYGTSSLLLQGQGPFMSVISNDSGKQIARLKVFRRNNVHGFMIDRACNDGVYILVWGGQSLRVVQFSGQRTKPDSNGAYLVNCTAEYAAPDWIFDACAPHTDDREAFAYLVTAHNAVLRVKLSNLDSSKYPRAIFLQQLVMGVKSILYSANIVAFGPSHIVIAAGTVFGEIIVWSCFLDQISSSQPDATAAIHHFFTGHEGSIFGVNISHEVLDKDGKRKRFLASCSDDRTIRIWDISDCCHATSADPSAYWTDGFELRSTGFGSTATENVTAGTEKYVAKAYGHLSRIWKVKFLPTMTKQVQRINLMSAGEDTTCQLWMLELPLTPAEQQYRLTNVTTLHRHAGKNIWSVALSSHPLEIYTGGADGAVRSFRLTFFGDAETKHPARQNESEISSRTYWSSKAVEKAGRSKVQTDDQPKVFAFVSQDSFLRISASGVVQIGRIENGENDTQPSIVCEPIAVVPDLKGFASLSSLPRTGIAIIGSGSGLIRLFDFSSRQLSDLVTVQSRPVTIFLFRAHTNQDGNSTLRRRVKFAVTYPNLPYADLFSVEQVNSETRHVDRARLLLPVPFAVSSSSLLLDGKYIMFGGKFGGMVLYKVEYGNDCELVWRDHRAHGTSLVSFMGTIPKDNDLEELTTDYLLTCGRDGNYSVYMLKSGFSEPRMIHRASLSLGQIEGFYFDPTSGHLMFIGFRGTMFVLWNESTQSEIMTFDCGNVHRWWVFQPYEDVPECGVILWNQARSLHAIDIRTSESRIIRVGSHGREIKDLAVFNPPQENAVPLIASGAEDTALRISTPSTCDTDPMWGSLRSLRVFTTHQTGLQKVSWSRDGRYLFSSAGQEEFFVWRMRLIPVFGLAAVVEARTEPVDKNADPRVTNFDIREIELSSGTDRFLIALVYSNSVVKVYSYASTEASHTFTLLATGTYTTNCLTQVQFLDLGSSTVLVTAATDGHLAVWPLNPLLEKITDHHGRLRIPEGFQPDALTYPTHYRIHASSVKALEVQKLSGDRVLLIGGGDDNSLSVTLFSAATDGATFSASTVSVPNPHAATITAVKIVGFEPASVDKAYSTVMLASAGNDQRVKIWTITVDVVHCGVDAISVTQRLDRASSIADISAMDVLELSASNRQLIIAGVGLEMLPLSSLMGIGK